MPTTVKAHPLAALAPAREHIFAHVFTWPCFAHCSEWLDFLEDSLQCSSVQEKLSRKACFAPALGEAFPHELLHCRLDCRRNATKRPAPGKWSVAEILAHLADTEIVSGYRMRSILGAPGTPISAFDQDRWAEAQNYAKRDPPMSLRVFRTPREANLSLLKSLKPEQWKQFGIHAERGEESIERIAQMFAGHDINHLRQIDAILAPKKK